MKNKSKIQTPSTSILNDSNNYSSYLSKDISFNDIKKDSINKYYSRNIIKKQKSRQINSLDELTKKFIKCVYESGSNRINLNNVMKKIKAKKRRIYDITNVLEGIGIIKKDAKNQIKLEPEFYELYMNNQNNIILLDEEKNKNNKIEKNKDKILNNNNNKLQKLNNEIKYVDHLINNMNERLLLLNPNLNNNLDILEHNLNLNLNNLNKNNNNSTNNNNKTLNLISKKCECNTRTDSINILDPNNLIHLLDNTFDLNSNKNSQQNQIFKIDLKQSKERKDIFVQNKKEEENFLLKEDYIDLFNENINKNEINFDLNENKNFNFRKDSFMSDLSIIGNLNNFPLDKENLFE